VDPVPEEFRPWNVLAYRSLMLYTTSVSGDKSKSNRAFNLERRSTLAKLYKVGRALKDFRRIVPTKEILYAVRIYLGIGS
jgi:hypothetical protein